MIYTGVEISFSEVQYEIEPKRFAAQFVRDEKGDRWSSRYYCSLSKSVNGIDPNFKIYLIFYYIKTNTIGPP